MLEKNKILAIIPARGGSKGIIKKNLKKIAGMSLLAHAIDCAKNTSIIDSIVVSSDCEQTLEEAERCGVRTFFKRPKELAMDTTPALPVWQHAWNTFEEITNKYFDITVWLQPTSPLRVSSDIIRAVEAIIKQPFDSSVTLSRLPGHFAPEKILILTEGGLLSRYLGNHESTDLRQQCAEYYYRNGHCYAANRQAIFEEQKIISKRCAPIILDGLTVNIDEPYELDIANCLYLKDK